MRFADREVALTLGEVSIMAVESIGPPPQPANSAPESIIVASPAPSDGMGAIHPFDDADGPSFSDLLDVLNPLQHIPIINTIYQQLTGDKEGAVADLAGGVLYGGLIGLGAAVVNLAVMGATGQSIGDNVVALFSDDSPSSATADNQPPATDPGQPAAAGQAADEIRPDVATTGSATGTSDFAGGPVSAGDFLIFGGTPIKTAAVQPASDKSVPSTSRRTPADGPWRSGDFMVFGGGEPAAASLPDTPVQLFPASAQATPAAAQTDNTPLPASAGGSHSFPVPARRASSEPPSALPLPTTGPAAVPGNGRAQGAARGTGIDQSGMTWFAGAFNQAMDKYNRAAVLGDTSSAAAGDGLTGSITPLN
jgi:hypothetical protein